MSPGTVDPGTKQALLRWRRARELELRRDVGLRSAERAVARRDALQAEAHRRRVETRLINERGQRVRAWERPLFAGRVANREAYEDVLVVAAQKARLGERRALLELDRAERALSEAQRALADAVHARQRSDAMQEADRRVTARAKERRESAEAEDRFRTRPSGLRK